ncbi:MAG: ThuA domain-containing protein [Proteobacteria bacterium]|nr:ThuA domain-containing protein [Pseudomonadota bacterium]
MMMLRRALLVLAVAVLLPSAALAKPAKEIVLIGGDTPHGPFVHDARAVITTLKRYLETSPDIRAMKDVAITAYPDGWPTDPHALDRAATIVWYFDGLDHHPLLDAARRARFEELMRRGVGLVTFHQASTLLPADRGIDLGRWLGGARYGMVDRTVETVAFTPAPHPVSRGVRPFAYRDEFYPTLAFGSAPVTPILTGMLHLEANPAAPATKRTVAWAFERPGGGRSFGFTGLHYSAALDQPELRKLLLNAIVWTAGIKVPRAGIRSEP